MSKIHPTAIVGKNAKIGLDVSIGPFCQIGDEVEIGARTEIAGHVVLDGKTKIGEENFIGNYTTIGLPAQYVGVSNDPGETIVGDRNVIRETVSINRGVTKHSGQTVVGNDNYIMIGVHIAHDCIIGNDSTLCNNTAMAGHTWFEDKVTTGAYALFHQFVSIGKFSMLAGGSVFTKDIPPFSVVSGRGDMELHGPNLVGLKRNGFDKTSIGVIKTSLQILKDKALTLAEATAAIKSQFPDSTEAQHLLEFIANSRRGVIR